MQKKLVLWFFTVIRYMRAVMKTSCLAKKMSNQMLAGLNCARPVVWSNKGCPTYPYSILGTCFIVKFGGTFYCLTARHVVGDRKPGDIVILKKSGAVTTLSPIDAYTIADTTDAELSCSDIVVYKLNYDSVLDSSGHYYTMTNNTYVNTTGTSLHVCGFPASLNAIDYEEMNLEIQGISISGSDIGSVVEAGVSTQIGLRTMKCSSAGELADFNGLSGSPVFAFCSDRYLPRTDENVFNVLAGMVLMGGTENCIINFLDIRIVLAALQQDAVH